MLDVKYLWEIWDSFSLLWLMVGFRLHSQTWFLSEAHNRLVRHMVQKISVSFWGERNLTIRRVNWPSVVSSSIGWVQAEIQTSGLFTVCYSYYIVNEVTQSCPTLCDPMDRSLPGSSVHAIFQARILEWVAISFSRRSLPRNWTRVSRIVGRCFTFWATREVLFLL